MGSKRINKNSQFVLHSACLWTHSLSLEGQSAAVCANMITSYWCGTLLLSVSEKVCVCALSNSPLSSAVQSLCQHVLLLFVCSVAPGADRRLCLVGSYQLMLAQLLSHTHKKLMNFEHRRSCPQLLSSFSSYGYIYAFSLPLFVSLKSSRALCHLATAVVPYCSTQHVPFACCQSLVLLRPFTFDLTSPLCRER